MGVILVRHAMPDVQRGVSPTLWRLSEAARQDCVILAHALPTQLAPLAYSSGQPKADETAAVIALRRGLQTAVDPRFREVDRPPAWMDDHREEAAAYLDGVDHPGWEPRAAVAGRLAAAVADASREDPELDVVVVSHGLAMTLWVASVVEIDPVPWWQALTFPDAWRIDLHTRSLKRAFPAVA